MLRSLIELNGWNAALVLMLVKATIILVAALGITLMMHRASATARHLVWLVTLGTLLLVPALTAWGPLSVAVLPAKANAVVLSGAKDLHTDVVVSGAKDLLVGNEKAGPSPVAQGDNVAVDHGSIMSRTMDTISAMSPMALIALVWSLVVAGILVSLAWATLAVNRIVRNARVLDSEDWMAPLFEISDRLSLEEAPRLLQSSATKMPFACGVMKATIVLPAESESWTLERRRAVLLHELAHVRRHDLLGHTVGRFACAVYWFHPLVWKAAKQLRNESERACDDLALSCGTRATDYAEHLLDIVTTVRGDATPLVALAMARRKEFEGRMLAILDPDLRRAGPTRKQSAALIAALALISLTVGAVAPVARTASAATVAQRIDPVSTPAAKPAPAAVPQAASKAYPDSGVRGVMHENTVTSVQTHTTTQTTTNTSTDTRPDAFGNMIAENVKVLASEGTRIGLQTAAAVLTETLLGDKGEKGGKGAKNDERVALLAKILRTDADPTLRRVAAWGLAEHTDAAEAIDALAEALRKDTNENVREMAAWALGEGGDRAASALTALNNALKSDASDKVRATSAWALGEMGDRANTEGLVAALNDPYFGVRYRAAWALGEVGMKTAPKPLVAMLTDKEPRARIMAAWALHEIEDPTTAAPLQAALKAEQNPEVQRALTKALLSLGEASVEAIKALLDSPDQNVKQMAVRALAGRNANGPWPMPMPEPRPFP